MSAATRLLVAQKYKPVSDFSSLIFIIIIIFLPCLEYVRRLVTRNFKVVM